MTALSIKNLLAEFATSRDRQFEVDRVNTIGASEIGQCLRKTWFLKNEVAQDESYVERYGARLRGTLIEDHYWEPALRWQTLQRGSPLQLHLAGKEQRTIVDGYISATPDGVLSGALQSALEWLGIPDIGPSGCIAVECKSLDPRADLRGVARLHHTFQVQVQLGLIRAHTRWKPDYGLLSYIDASFLDEVSEFAVAFDPAVYEAAQDRAQQVMAASVALELSPEGKVAGGAECRYCPWASHCAKVVVAGIPRDTVPLGDNALAELKTLRDDERALNDRIERLGEEHAGLKQAIKEFLPANHTRRVQADGWEVNWSITKGRETVDIHAAEATGLDLSPWRRTGDPGDRLVIK